MEPAYIAAARDVVANGYKKVDGMLLDSSTAQGMLQVWDALSPENRQMVMDKKISFVRFVDIMWKLVKR